MNELYPGILTKAAAVTLILAGRDTSSLPDDLRLRRHVNTHSSHKFTFYKIYTNEDLDGWKKIEALSFCHGVECAIGIRSIVSDKIKEPLFYYK